MKFLFLFLMSLAGVPGPYTKPCPSKFMDRVSDPNHTFLELDSIGAIQVDYYGFTATDGEAITVGCLNNPGTAHHERVVFYSYRWSPMDSWYTAIARVERQLGKPYYQTTEFSGWRGGTAPVIFTQCWKVHQACFTGVLDVIDAYLR